MKPWQVVLASVLALILFVAASVVALALLGTERPWILALLVVLDVAVLYVLFVVADRLMARCADDDPQVAPAAEVPRVVTTLTDIRKALGAPPDAATRAAMKICEDRIRRVLEQDLFRPGEDNRK